MDAGELYRALYGAKQDPGWPAMASCRELPADLFYPEEREPAARVKAICRSCAVQLDCLAHAISTRETHGIWGGLTSRQRSRLARFLRESGYRIPGRERRSA